MTSGAQCQRNLQGASSFSFLFSFVRRGNERQEAQVAMQMVVRAPAEVWRLLGRAPQVSVFCFRFGLSSSVPRAVRDFFR